MSCYSKEKIESNDNNNTCKSHSARSDREIYRICPSKLSKRELEDLYFTLLENNIDLKRTVNGQQDKIRGLSTRVQRLTNTQKNLYSKNMKDCCIGTKSIITEQKDSIAELKRTNYRLTERIQCLNMRLCSAKQFFKKTPQAPPSKCSRWPTNSTSSPPKNSQTYKTTAPKMAERPRKTSCLDKANEQELKTTTTSTQCDDNCAALSVKSVQTESLECEKQTSEKPCDENKCRSLMEELKMKIVDLQEELCTVHNEYSNRISRLEGEVLDVRTENVRVCGERQASEHELRNSNQKNTNILATCRTFEAQCAELSAQLAIEKRKVAELETQLKAANMTDKVNKTIEDHLTNIKETSVPPQGAEIISKETCSCDLGSQNASPQEVICTCNECPSTLPQDAPVQSTAEEVICNCDESPLTPPQDEPVQSTAEEIICACDESPLTPPQDEPVQSTAEVDEEVICGCPPWQEASNSCTRIPAKSDLSKASSKASSKPRKISKTKTPEVICACYKYPFTLPQDEQVCEPVRNADSPLLKTSTPTKDLNSKCMECCFNQQKGGLVEKSPDKPWRRPGDLNHRFQLKTSIRHQSLTMTETCSSPKVAETKSSLSKHHDEGKISKASDDSGYLDANRSQDSDELAINKLNKELIAKILELQSQLDAMKIAGSVKTGDQNIAPNILDGSNTLQPDGSVLSSELKRPEKINNMDNGGSNKAELVPDKLEMPSTKENTPSKLKPELETINEIYKPYGIQINPEKLKYLEAKENIKEREFEDKSKSTSNDSREIEKTEETESESRYCSCVPSNSDLELGMPRIPDTKDKIKLSSELPSKEERPNNVDILPDKLNLPMTDANKETPVKPTEETTTTKDEDGCNYCAACSLNTEPTHNKDARGTKMQHDQLNSLQIPGPIPTAVTNNKDKKKNIFRPFSSDKKKEKTKDKSYKQKKDSLSKEDKIIRQKIIAEETSSTTDGLICKPKKEAEAEANLLEMLRRHDYMVSKESMHKGLSISRSNSVTKDGTTAPMRNASMQNYTETSDRMLLILNKPHSCKEDTQVECMADFEQQVDQPPRAQPNEASNVESTCRSRMESTRKRDVKVYRRSSGTLCFHTLPAAPQARHCNCPCRTRANSDAPPADKGIQVEVNQEKQSPRCPQTPSTMEQGTYLVGSKQTRATSPDSTDFEMTYMSDLPLEKEKKCSFEYRALSPGEEKTTTSYSDSYSTPANNYSLSEGEMPITPKRKVPHKYEQDRERPQNTSMLEESATQRMEAALQAITEELTRCKNLLHAQRPAEGCGTVRKRYRGPGTQRAQVPLQAQQPPLQAFPTPVPQPPLPSKNRRRSSCQSKMSMTDVSLEQPLALRRCFATQNLGETYVPNCVFSLHIGNVVLSDEAVLNSRDKNFLLTWKFYDQNIAMTRMRTGRVVLFDFSTEYEIKITDEFFNYMKQEEMPIIICELDKEYQPFATCALPLRDALLNPNRRVDMSLALVAGPQMLKARAEYDGAADLLDARDEVGVIDLWCMLRADDYVLPGINLAIAQPIPPMPAPLEARDTYVTSQTLDDYDDDMGLARIKPVPDSTATQTGTNICKDVEYIRTSHDWSTSTVKTRKESDATTRSPTRAELLYDPSNYPPMRSRQLSDAGVSTTETFPPQSHTTPRLPHTNALTSHTTPRLPHTNALTSHTTPLQWHTPPDIPEHDPGIIVNEVRAKIKSPSDMRHALEKSCLKSDYGQTKPKTDELAEPVTRDPYNNDLTSQAHSSFGSIRSVLARLQRRGSRPSAQHHRDSAQRIACQNIKKNGKSGAGGFVRTEESDIEIYKKYDNISKLIGTNRSEKKCVTIEPKYQQFGGEVPQRDVDSAQKGDVDQYQDDHKTLDITVLWLALNEECDAMIDPRVQRVFVAYSFLGRSGAELETPVSLPKPKHYVDKCFFNFRKTFELEDTDLPMLGHMARCRAARKTFQDEKDCIVFAVVSEPPEDPLGIESCEDIGYAYLYLGDLLAYSAGNPGYTEVIPVRAARGPAAVCGVLAVRMDGLDLVRRCLQLPNGQDNNY